MSAQGEQKQNFASVIPTAKARNELQTRRVPTPGAHEVLVRNYAVAVNPIDWKIQDYSFLVEKYPNVLGSDVAGVVDAVGLEVKNVKVGDRVAGYAGVIWNQNPDEGAFQTYTILRDIATAVLPASISFPSASSLPMQVATAGSTFFLNFGFDLPSNATLPSNYTNQGILIYGATSAVGTTLIQFARQFGFTIFAVASAKHEKYVKLLGATYFFARDKAGFEEAIITQSKESKVFLNYGVDCISEGSTFTTVGDILSKARQPGSIAKLANVLPWPEDLPTPKGVAPKNTGAYEIFSRVPNVGKWVFNEYLPKQLHEGSLVPSPPVKVVDGGLASTQHAWDINKNGVSATKLILILQEE